MGVLEYKPFKVDGRERRRNGSSSLPGCHVGLTTCNSCSSKLYHHQNCALFSNCIHIAIYTSSTAAMRSKTANTEMSLQMKGTRTSV